MINPLPIRYLNRAPDDIGQTNVAGAVTSSSEIKSPQPIFPDLNQSPKVNRVCEHEKIGIREYKLDNGLRVILIPTEEATVSGSLIFKSGSIEDPEGQKGIAHLLEHLAAVRESASFSEEEFEEFTDITNGYENAGTDTTSTFYEWILQPEHLDYGIERFQDLLNRKTDFSQSRVDNEKKIIRNELLSFQDVNETQQSLAEQSFWGSRQDPRNSPVGGFLTDLQAITAEDLDTFYKTHYRPDNSVLVLSGPIDLDDTLAKVERNFGNISNPNQVLEKQTLSAYKAQKRPMERIIENHYEDGLELRYRIPGNLNGDKAALNALAMILEDRLTDPYRNPYYTNIADSSVEISDFGNSGEFNISLSFTETKESKLDRKKVRRYILGLISGIKRNGISALERKLLDTAQDEYLKSIREEKEAGNKYSFVVSNEMGVSNWHKQLTQQENGKIATERIQAVAKNYLGKQNRTSIFYVQKPLRHSRQTRNTSHSIPIIEPEDIEITIPKALKGSTRPTDIRDELKTKLFESSEFNLIHCEAQKKPIQIFLRKKGGQRASPENKTCLADLTEIFLNNLMRFDEGRKNSLFGGKFADNLEMSIADELIDNRLQLSFKCSENYHSIFLQGPQENKDKLESLLQKVCSREFITNFSDQELETILNTSKAELLSVNQDIYSDPNSAAEIEFRRHILSKLPTITDKDIAGISKELSAINLEDVLNFYQEHYGLAGGDLAISGAYNTSDLKKLQPTFKSWLEDYPQQKTYSTLKQSAQTKNLEDSLYIHDRSTVSTVMGKSWNFEKHNGEFKKSLQIAKFLIEKKLVKAIRKNLSKIYDIKVQLETFTDSNLGLTQIEFEAEKEDQVLLQNFIKQVLQIVTDRGFSNEEIALAKLHLLYREKGLRSDQAQAPFRFLNGTELDFEDYKTSLANLSKDHVNRLAQNILDPKQFSSITAA